MIGCRQYHRCGPHQFVPLISVYICQSAVLGFSGSDNFQTTKPNSKLLQGQVWGRFLCLCGCVWFWAGWRGKAIPVPNCPGLRPGQFGTPRWSVHTGFPVRSRPQNGWEARPGDPEVHMHPPAHQPDKLTSISCRIGPNLGLNRPGGGLKPPEIHQINGPDISA